MNFSARMHRRQHKQFIRSVSARNISERLVENHIKISTVLSHCREIDKNHDGLIHLNDLEDVLQELLGKNARISKRELLHLAADLEPDHDAGDGIISFEKLAVVLAPSEGKEGPSQHHAQSQRSKIDDEEHWIDPLDHKKCSKKQFRRGSLGHFMQDAASPAEVNNFHTFMYCIEQYENRTGLRCQATEDGFVIPFGPDLKGRVTFSMDGR
jgi:hypothetical protein